MRRVGERGDTAHRRTHAGRTTLLLQSHGGRHLLDAVDVGHAGEDDQRIAQVKSAVPAPLTAGAETADPLAFLARALVHIRDKGHVTTRYDGDATFSIPQSSCP